MHVRYLEAVHSTWGEAGASKQDISKPRWSSKSHLHSLTGSVRDRALSEIWGSPEVKHLTVVRKKLPRCEGALQPTTSSWADLRSFPRGERHWESLWEKSLLMRKMPRWKFCLLQGECSILAATGLLRHCTYDHTWINAGIFGGVAAGLEGSLSQAPPPLLGMEMCPLLLSVAQWIFTSSLNFNTPSKWRG